MKKWVVFSILGVVVVTAYFVPRGYFKGFILLPLLAIFLVFFKRHLENERMKQFLVEKVDNVDSASIEVKKNN